MTERSIFWRRHLEAIHAEGISTVAYAERERLSLGSLYQWRQKLKSDFGIPISQAPSSSSGFVAVRVTEHYETNTSWSLRVGDLEIHLPGHPDVKWLASLALELQGRGI
ncbi:MAG: cobyrinic acid ac-diamide synthase [Gammaproteobacteria bacterium]|nr:cobyrinic acid ac-diamide synthase [Gammaproteobacteria bacterium]